MSASLSLRENIWRTSKTLPGLQDMMEGRYGPLLHAAVRDPWNRVRFGPDAPRFAERLWIDPRTVRGYDRKGVAWKSGRVVTGAWAQKNERPIEEDLILQSSIAHWVHGRSWEESGEVDRMLKAIEGYPGHAGCFNRQDILQRCARLDDIFRVIQREGRVRSQDQLDAQTFREFGGIGMHVGPNGALIRGGHGRHRFAMAWILEIPLVPVRIGMVHHSSLFLLKELRVAGRHRPYADDAGAGASSAA
jgi:hypothetical protein